MTAVHLAHITVVHPRYDTRILFKQCASLRAAGVGRVSLWVADGRGDEEVDGVQIRDVGVPPGGRPGRALLGSLRMLREVRRAKPALVHLHDPELLPLGLLLHAAGTRVVFDMHENLPKEILTKAWVRPAIRRALGAAVGAFQRYATRRLPTVFAEESYAADFPGAREGTNVLNYPLLSALAAVKAPKASRFSAGYIGSVTGERGGTVMVEAVHRLRADGIDAAATFVGPVLADVQAAPAFQRATGEGWLEAPGRLPPTDGWHRMAACHVGLAVLQPSPNFVDSLPTKLLEYMALGLPVVVSDFPMWRGIVERAGCGLVVDPADPAAVARALRWLHDNPAEAARMGQRGRAAAVAGYDWRSQFQNLGALYQRLLAR